MRPVGTVVTLVILLVLLIAAVWFAYSGMTADGGGTIPGYGYAAMATGIVLLLIVGVGLMSLLFYSSRHGYDEPPRMRNRDD